MSLISEPQGSCSEAKGHGWLLGAMYHALPPIVSLFRALSQYVHMDPNPFVIFTSRFSDHGKNLETL